MQAVRLVEVSADDWEFWSEVRLRALRGDPEAFGSTYEGWKDAPESRWRERLGGESLDLVAVLDGRAVGLASGVPGERAGTAELISMWVDPAVRRQGVAARLIERIAAWAGARGDELWLSVMTCNRAAIASYERCGFVISDEPGDPLPSWAPAEIRMRRKES